MKTLAALIRTQWDRAGALALVIVGCWPCWRAGSG